MFASLCCQFFSFLQDAHADVKMEIGFKYANKLLSNDIEAIECKREREEKSWRISLSGFTFSAKNALFQRFRCFKRKRPTNF